MPGAGRAVPAAGLTAQAGRVTRTLEGWWMRSAAFTTDGRRVAGRFDRYLQTFDSPSTRRSLTRRKGEPGGTGLPFAVIMSMREVRIGGAEWRSFCASR